MARCRIAWLERVALEIGRGLLDFWSIRRMKLCKKIRCCPCLDFYSFLFTDWDPMGFIAIFDHRVAECFLLFPSIEHANPRLYKGKSPFLIGDTSSNACFSMVMSVFGGVTLWRKLCFFWGGDLHGRFAQTLGLLHWTGIFNDIYLHEQ